jgi:hypothetical protein
MFVVEVADVTEAVLQAATAIQDRAPQPVVDAAPQSRRSAARPRGAGGAGDQTQLAGRG